MENKTGGVGSQRDENYFAVMRALRWNTCQKFAQEIFHSTITNEELPVLFSQMRELLSPVIKQLPTINQPK